MAAESTPDRPEAKWLQLPYRECLKFYASALGKAKESGPTAFNDAQRTLAENDLFYLLTFILNRHDIFHPWLFERCREFQANPDGHIDLWARDHYKSSIITFGGTIFEIIRNPEITIGIFSHTKPIAKGFLRQIKQEFEKNELLFALWPDIFYARPKVEAQKWSEDGGLIVKRKTNPKEATIEAHGLVDGQPTSKHFGILHYDDVVTLESVSTPEQIQKTTNALFMSYNLGSKSGRKRFIGTRYHLFDTYSTVMESGTAIPRIHPATHNGREDGRPVFLTAEILRKKRIEQGPYVFSSQQLLNPTADKAMGFRREWLRHADIDMGAAKRSLWRFIIVDPSSGKSRKNKTAAKNGQQGGKDNDFTTMMVIGHGADEQYRVLDMVRDRLNLSARWNALYDLHTKWNPELVAYEEYGMQADIEHFKFCMEQKLYEFTITPVGGNMPKELRILRLVPYFENGWKESVDVEGKARIILPTSLGYINHEGHNRDLVKDFIEHEYVAFPVLKHDDMLDCLGRIPDLEQMGLIQKPNLVPAEGVNHGFTSGLKNRGDLGNSSYMTA